ncbi:hypothetical protein, partial [Proteus myxofaciens]|uniref:hypothetical protein n=1 Tax=Proteus myxofaciens TaxID=184072 RepID=UPI001428911B
PASDKKENINFLLSSEITNCSNSLSPDNFFILEEKGNDKKIYIDKNIFTKIENELTNAINDYIKYDLKHLDKINKASNKNNDLFLISKSFNNKKVVNIKTIESARKLISSISNEAKSSNLKNMIFHKNNIVNLFFNGNILGNIKSKSINKIISDKKNEKIVINLGCELPYEIEHNKILLIKLGSIGIDDNKLRYKSKCENNKKVVTKLDVKEDIVPIDRDTLTKFEILFNFLNSNVKEIHGVIYKYNNCKNINEFSKAFSFSENSEKLFLNIYKELNKLEPYENIEHYEKIYYKFNESAKELKQFYQDYLKKENFLKISDNDQLLEMTKKIEFNVDSLKNKLNILKPFFIACEEYENKINDIVSNLINKRENTSCSLIKYLDVKINEYKTILTNCIKRKEDGFLSKIYKFFFFEKYEKHIHILNEYLVKVDKILHHFENCSNDKQSVFSDNEIIKTLRSILSETPPIDLLSYLYGENKKWNNFKKSLFN